jgi:hypothetical protein
MALGGRAAGWLAGVWLLAAGLAACGGSGSTGAGDIVYPDGVDQADGGDVLSDSGDALPEGQDPDAEAATPDGDQGHDGDGTPEETGPAMHGIKFVTPLNQASATGSILVSLAATDVPEWLVDEVVVALDGQPIFKDTKLPTDFVLDTTLHPNGPAFLEAAAHVLGEFVTVHVDLSMDNPAFGFRRVFPQRPVYRNAEPISLEIDLGQAGLSLNADFSALDSAFEPAAVGYTDNGDGTYRVVYSVSAANLREDGQYPVGLSAGDGTYQLAYGGTRVQLQNRKDIPVQLLGALFVEDRPPVSSEEAAVAPTLAAVTGNDAIITGGTASLELEAADPQGAKDIVGLIVEVDGYHGYYQRPVEFFAGKAELVLLLSTLNNQQIDFDKLTLVLSAIDAEGHRSQPVQHPLKVVKVGSGDIQVSVSWDTPTDVDLHVVSPYVDHSTGEHEEIWYGSKSSNPSGGVLDLDSNAGCSLDYVNNENITWPQGKSPEGTYIVRVDYYDNCYEYGPTNYIVTVKNCGTVKTFDGTFTAGDSDGGSEGSGTTVTTFESSCGGIVHGYVRYEDQTYDTQGYRARTWKPARYSRVEVRRQADNALLASGHTDRHGHYQIRFANAGPAGVFVLVFAESNIEEGLRKISVRNHPKFGLVYAWSAPAFDETQAEERTLDIDIPEEDELGRTWAGAWNIFDSVVAGHDRIRLMTGRDLGQMNVYWQTGADTTETSYCSKLKYDAGGCTLYGTLSIQGREEDRDEYDDAVILQEVFRYAQDRVSISDDPGGHADGSRDDPVRAWGDGSSMFFATDTLRLPYFLNKNRYGVYRVYDLEQMASPFSFGTSSGTLDGRLSPFLVAAALNDIADGGAQDDDGLAAPLGIYDSIFHYLANPQLATRGVPGRDLVDFLDGWFCRGHGQQAAVTAIVNTGRKFPYDYQFPIICE